MGGDGGIECGTVEAKNIFRREVGRYLSYCRWVIRRNCYSNMFDADGWVEVFFGYSNSGHSGGSKYMGSLLGFATRLVHLLEMNTTRSVYELEDWNCSCKKVIEKQAEPERDNKYPRAEGQKSRYFALCEALNSEILCHFKECLSVSGEFIVTDVEDRVILGLKEQGEVGGYLSYV